MWSLYKLVLLTSDIDEEELLQNQYFYEFEQSCFFESTFHLEYMH